HGRAVAASSRSAFRSHYCERRALRVAALDDPAAAGDLHRAVENLPAAVLRPRRGAIDGLDVEVIKPERRGRLRRLGHHAAGLGAINREGVSGTQRAHVDRLALGSAEQIGIEAEGAFALAAV